MVMDLLGPNLSTVRRGALGGALEPTAAKVKRRPRSQHVKCRATQAALPASERGGPVRRLGRWGRWPAAPLWHESPGFLSPRGSAWTVARWRGRRPLAGSAAAAGCSPHRAQPRWVLHAFHHAGCCGQHAESTGAGACGGLHPPRCQASQLCDGPRRCDRPRIGWVCPGGPSPLKARRLATQVYNWRALVVASSGQAPACGLRAWAPQKRTQEHMGALLQPRCSALEHAWPDSSWGWRHPQADGSPVWPPLCPQPPGRWWTSGWRGSSSMKPAGSRCRRARRRRSAAPPPTPQACALFAFTSAACCAGCGAASMLHEPVSVARGPCFRRDVVTARACSCIASCPALDRGLWSAVPGCSGVMCLGSVTLPVGSTLVCD